MPMAHAFGSAALALFLVYMTFTPGPVWRADYYPNPSLDGPSKGSRLRNAGFTHPSSLPVGLVEREDFSLRLRSCLRVMAAGSFRFRVMADDGARLYVDGQLVVDAWNGPGSVEGKPFQLETGNHQLTIEFSNSGGGAQLAVEVGELGAHEFRNLQGRTELPSEGGLCENT
jgi:hypothetical protein